MLLYHFEEAIMYLNYDYNQPHLYNDLKLYLIPLQIVKSEIDLFQPIIVHHQQLNQPYQHLLYLFPRYLQVHFLFQHHLQKLQTHLQVLLSQYHQYALW